MNFIDWLVVAAACSLVFVVGLTFARRSSKKGAEGYFAGDRDVPWWAIGLPATSAGPPMLVDLELNMEELDGESVGCLCLIDEDSKSLFFSSQTNPYNQVRIRSKAREAPRIWATRVAFRIGAPNFTRYPPVP